MNKAPDALEWQQDFIATNLLAIGYNAMNAHILDAVDTYNPATEVVFLLESFNQVTFFYLKNLSIAPPQCYAQVCKEWSEFQPQAVQPNNPELQKT